jgi:hypothetical protein
MRAEVVAAVAQATIRHQAKEQTGLLAGGLRFGTSQPGTEVRHGEVTPLECQGRSFRLQLKAAGAAIERLQGVVEQQQSRISALEAGDGAHTGERREARPRLRTSPVRAP